MNSFRANAQKSLLSFDYHVGHRPSCRSSHCQTLYKIPPKIKFRRPSLPFPPPKSRGEGGSQKFQNRKKFLCQRNPFVQMHKKLTFTDHPVHHRPIVKAVTAKLSPLLISLESKPTSEPLFLQINLWSKQSLLKNYQLQLLVSATDKNRPKMEFRKHLLPTPRGLYFSFQGDKPHYVELLSSSKQLLSKTKFWIK